MDVPEDAVRDIYTDAVFERGERYRDEGHIREIYRVNNTVTAVVSGSRQYDVRVDIATDGFAPRCGCPYDGPGACKHVVAVLLRCVDDLPPDDDDQLDAAFNDADDLCAFLREELSTDTDLRARFLAHVGEPTRQSVDELRASIDRRFKETNPEYHVVFEPIDFTQWFDLANEYREQERYASAAIVYRALTKGETYRVALISTSTLDTEAADTTEVTQSTDHAGQQHEYDGSPVEEGEQRDVEIENLGDQGDGIAKVEHGYAVIVSETSVGDRVTVEMKQVRENVAFADVVDDTPRGEI